MHLPIKSLLLLITLSGWILSCPTTCCAQDHQPIPYEGWKARCLKTPANRILRGRFPAREQLPLPDFRVVEELALQTLQAAQRDRIADLANWIGAKPDRGEFFDISRSYFTRPPIRFQPFAQKLNVEAGAELIFHGDFHGDIRSLISTLEWLNEHDRMEGFKIKRPNTYLVFLGDYADRGAYGVEVIYTLLRLKLANPDRVLMARGNHEDFQLTALYGFLREGQTKYGEAFSPLPIWRCFDFLPVVLYVGCGVDFVQCNHGGMEAGYNPTSLLNSTGSPRFQMLGELQQRSFAEEHAQLLNGMSETRKERMLARLDDFTPQSPTAPAPIGFMWNDYSIFASDPALAFNQDRLAFIFGSSATRYLLQAASAGRADLKAVFRAHQHSSQPTPMMNRLVASNGAFRHWQTTDRKDTDGADRASLQGLIEVTPERSIPVGSVWTFNVSPDSLYGLGNKYSFDTIGIVQTAESFQDWRLRVVNVPVNME